VLSGLEVWRNDGGLGQSNEKSSDRRETNIKEKAVTMSEAAASAKRAERNGPSAASAAWTGGEMTRRAGTAA